MKTKFTYDDVVIVKADAPIQFRPGEKAWVVGVFDDRNKDRFEWLPDGVVYCIEFESGEAIDVDEASIRRA